MERVRKAAPADFSDLLEQWKTAFPLDWNDSGRGPSGTPAGWNDAAGRPENTLRWLFLSWLEKDPEGFLKMAKTPSFEHAGRAAQVYAKMRPEEAARLLFGPEKKGLDADFLMKGAWELAESHPLLYLKIDPVGEVRIVEGMMFTSHWETAVKSLAKTDAVAAAEVCVGSKLDKYNLGNVLESIAGIWKSDKPTMLEWLNGIKDPGMREVAIKARLLAMAEKDAHAAFEELKTVSLDHGEEYFLNLSEPILMRLTKADPVKAFHVLKEMESLFSKREGSKDGVAAGNEKEGAVNPFIYLAPKPGEKPEANAVRSMILTGAEHGFPDDAGFFGIFDRVRQEMNGDSEWLRDIEVDLIRRKTDRLSGTDCLTMARMWADRLDGRPDDETFGALAKRAAMLNPELVVSSLDQFPESVRSFFAGEAIKRLPDAGTVRNITLLGHLTEREWDQGVGEVLGRNAAAYVEVIASLPAKTTQGAREAFAKQWGISDPDAAAGWVESLPDDAAALPAARGLVLSWAGYDPDAAMFWAAALPAGATRDGAAASLCESLAGQNTEEARQWAQSISDTVVREEMLARVDLVSQKKAAEKSDGVSERMRTSFPRPKSQNPPPRDPSDPFSPP